MSARYVTSDQIVDQVRAMIKFGVTQASLAKRFGVSRAHLNDFLHKRRGVGPKILAALGYDTTAFYRGRP